jgi:protein gp37
MDGHYMEPCDGVHESESRGCTHCYAETFAKRFRGVPDHPCEQGFDLKLWPDRLDLPLAWKGRKMIFVNSMSDLFDENVPDDVIAKVFDVMGQPSIAFFRF